MIKRLLSALMAVSLCLTPSLSMGATVAGKDGTGALKYWTTNGDGSGGNPYIQHMILSDGVNTATVQTAGADAGSNAASRLAITSWLQGFNGSSWDRLRVGLFSPTSSVTGYLNTLPFGRYNATPPTLTDGQFVALQLNSAGVLKVDPSGSTQPISGTIAATQSGSWSVGLSAGSNTVGKIDQGVGGVSAWKVDGSAFTQPVSGTFWQSVQPVSGTFWQSTQPISAASLPLPSGAAAAAKQPALGTAGTASTDVLTVQGITSMTPLKVDGSGFTQPVSGTFWQNTQPISGTVTVQQSTASNLKVDLSGTAANATAIKVDGSAVTQPVSGTFWQSTQPISGSVTANIGTSGSLALDATLTGGSQKAIVRGGAKGSTSAADVTSSASGSNHQPLDVVIYDTSGNAITSFGGSGGTSSSFGSSFPAPGTAAGFSDGSNMQGARVFDGDTGAGTEYGLGVILRKSASGGTVEAGTSSNPLRVDPTGTTAQPITDNGGSLTVDNGGTFAVQATVAAGATNIAKAEDVASADGDVGVPAMAVRKATPANTSGTDGDYEPLQISAGRLWTSAVIDTALPTGSNVIGALSANQSTNVAQLAGTTTDTNSGNKTAGTLRVVLATDQPQLTNKLLVTPDANSAINVSQINGVTPLMGNGVTGTGSPRVTIASDNTAFTVNSAQSGTWTVQPGNTANSTPWLMAQQATTAGGASLSKVISAASTNATSVKGSAGQVYFLTASNINASPRYLKLYNKASSPTVGTDTPVFTFLIPGNTAGAGSNIPVPDCGLAFSTGIALAITTGVADNDSGAVAANDIVVNIGYK